MGRLTRKFGFLRGATARTTKETVGMSGAYRDASGRMRMANSQFMAGANSAKGFSSRLGGIRSGFSRLGETAVPAMSSLATGLMTMGVMLSAVTAGVGKLVGNYNDFNKQMSVVRSVAGDISTQEFEALRQQAVALGSATAFTATEAAEGLENLARAGFSVTEAIGASRATLDLAAADSLGLAEAAGITANVIRGLGLSAEKDSQRVADVLAKASASANTDVTLLGESFKMGVGALSFFNIEVEEGAALLAKLADAGMKGTMGGTALSAMLFKLAKPTDKAAGFMKKMGINLTDANGKMRKVGDVVRDVSEALSTIPDEGKRSAMAVELTGRRGVRALGALSRAVEDSKLDQLETDLKGASGTAKRMADERLNNLSGQITILKSAAEGFTIRLFDLFRGLDGTVLKPVVDGMILLNETWDSVKSALDEGLLDEKKSELEAKHGSTMVAIVLGIRDAADTLRDAFTAIGEKLKAWGASAESAFGPDAIRRITKLVIMAIGLAAAFGPVIAAVGGLAFLASALIPVFQAVAAVAVGAFVPVLVIAAGIGAAFLIMRTEGESFSAFMSRMWASIKDLALSAWNNGIKPFWEGIKQGAAEVWPAVKAAGEEAMGAVRDLVMAVQDLWARLTEKVSKSKTDWQSVGAMAAMWLGKIVKGATRLVTTIIQISTVIIDTLRPVIVAVKDIVVSLWTQGIQPFLAGLVQGWTQVWPTLKMVALEVFDAIKQLVFVLMDTWNQMTSGVSSSSIDWQEVGRVAVHVIGTIIVIALKLVKWAIHAIRIVIEIVSNAVQLVIGYFRVVWSTMKRSISVVTQFFGGLLDAFMMVASGDVLGAFKTAGLAILNFLLSPIRLIVGAVADLVDQLLGLSAVKKLLPESQLKGMREFTGSMRKFADQGVTLAELPAEATGKPGKFVAPKIEDSPDTEAFNFGGMTGVGGFGGEALAALEAKKLEFEAKDKRERDQENTGKMAEEMATKTAEAVEQGLKDTTLETTNNVTQCIDGKEVSRSVAKHSQRLGDRLGATTPPFVRRTSADQGMIPSQ